MEGPFSIWLYYLSRRILIKLVLGKKQVIYFAWLLSFGLTFPSCIFTPGFHVSLDCCVWNGHPLFLYFFSFIFSAARLNILVKLDLVYIYIYIYRVNSESIYSPSFMDKLIFANVEGDFGVIKPINYMMKERF